MDIQLKIILLVISAVTACRQSNPEAVLGIKLGERRDQQVNALLRSGEIKTKNDQNYIYYASNVLADIYVYPIDDANGNDIVYSVSLQFYDPGCNFNPPVRDKFMTPLVTGYIRRMYFNKYGEPDSKKVGVSQHYTWNKGDMEIELNFNYFALPYNSDTMYRVFASYDYTQEIRKQLKQNENKHSRKF